LPLPGLPYFNPPQPTQFAGPARRDSVQDTRRIHSVEPDNLGHGGVLTTFCSYGVVGTRRQSEIMQDLGKPQPADPGGVAEFAKALACDTISQNKFLRPIVSEKIRPGETWGQLWGQQHAVGSRFIKY
jgi:hypothetical protein